MSVQRLVSDKIVIRESTGFSYGANVGIGTTVVTATFQVVESGNTDAIRVDNENTTTFVVNTNGNVGIGISQPGNYRLNVEGAARLRTLYTSNLEIMSAATGPALKVSQTGTQPLAEFIDAESGSALFISNNGNVGIGTTQTGTHSLQVQGSVNAVGGLNVGETSVINASGNIPSADRLPVVTVPKGGTGQTNLTAGKLLVGAGTGAVTLPANLHWDSANNRLGVGTATPLQTFNVFGNALIDGTLSASNMVVLGDFTTLNTLTSNTEQMVINNAGTGPALIVRQTGAQPVAEFIDAESGSALLIANDGKIGIGTTIPTEALRVQGNILTSGSIDAGTQFLGQANDTVTAPSFSWTGDTNCGIYRPAADTIAFTTGGTEKVRIASGGSVGIGTTATGTHALQVQGSINATAGLNVGSTSVIDTSGNIPSADRLPVVTVAKGGTGQTTLAANKVVVGNGTTGVLTPTNLHWDNGNSRLGIASATPGTPLDVVGVARATTFTSTQATGTAPLTVASTTVVTNLNADLLDGNHASAFATVNQTMNIGTTAVAINRGSGAQTLTGVSIDGNAATASATSQTLTRGSYLTGNNFNGSAATTWAVDATSANTSSKVVARDASGNFSAGTISATQLTGFGIGTNYVGAGSGHDNATLTQYNMAIRSWWGIGFPSYDNINRIVFDTRSGNIIAGTITASLNGNASTATSSGSCTGNSATVTNGVYTTGDQTISGNKTFTSTMILSNLAHLEFQGTAHGTSIWFQTYEGVSGAWTYNQKRNNLTIHLVNNTFQGFDAPPPLKSYMTFSITGNSNNGSIICHVQLVQQSDDRLKSEERFIKNATETLLKLRPQLYKKHTTLGYDPAVDPGVLEAGLIAQEVYYAAPELRHLVNLSDDATPSDVPPPQPDPDTPSLDPDYSTWGSKPAGISYLELIPYIIRSIQEKDAEIKQLRSELENMKALFMQHINNTGSLN